MQQPAVAPAPFSSTALAAEVAYLTAIFSQLPPDVASCTANFIVTAVGRVEYSICIFLKHRPVVAPENTTFLAKAAEVAYLTANFFVTAARGHTCNCKFFS